MLHNKNVGKKEEHEKVSKISQLLEVIPAFWLGKKMPIRVEKDQSAGVKRRDIWNEWLKLNVAKS